jgi:DNA-binding NarL/FixJ family response regulator
MKMLSGLGFLLVAHARSIPFDWVVAATGGLRNGAIREGMTKIHTLESQSAEGDQVVRLSESASLTMVELRKQTPDRTPADIVEVALAAYAKLHRPNERTAYEQLTPRLQEVLRLIAEGHSTGEIAYRLGISSKTVEFHRAQLIRRLGIQGIAALARFAVRVGAVPP